MKKKVRLTNRDVLELYNALAALDGYQRVVDDKVVNVPYEIDGITRLDIGLNKRLLRDKKEAIEEAHNGLVAALSKGKNDIPETIKDKEGNVITNPAFVECNLRYRDLLKRSADITLIGISVKALHVGVKDDPTPNPIPGTVIELLHPVLLHLPE